MRSRASAGLLSAAALSACTGVAHRMVADTPVRIGRPYTVHGQTYVPADDRDYDATGLASWYGPREHRGTTANGERFDTRRIGAAHRTLPLPSYVEVTALATGRRVVVRVNDRGPFVAGRIIDLSYAAAELLGITRAGLARVRVRRVYPDRQTRDALRSGRPGRALPSVATGAEIDAADAPLLARGGDGGYRGATPPSEGR